MATTEVQSSTAFLPGLAHVSTSSGANMRRCGNSFQQLATTAVAMTSAFVLADGRAARLTNAHVGRRTADPFVDLSGRRRTANECPARAQTNVRIDHETGRQLSGFDQQYRRHPIRHSIDVREYAFILFALNSLSLTLVLYTKKKSQ